MSMLMLHKTKRAYANFEPRFFAHMSFAHVSTHERGMMMEHEQRDECSAWAHMIRCFNRCSCRAVMMEHERGSVSLRGETLFSSSRASSRNNCYKLCSLFVHRQLRNLYGGSKKINPHAQAHARASGPAEKK